MFANKGDSTQYSHKPTNHGIVLRGRHWHGKHGGRHKHAVSSHSSIAVASDITQVIVSVVVVIKRNCKIST